MALRVASLDYLGTVAARLRKDAVTSKMDQRSIDRILQQVEGQLHILVPLLLEDLHPILFAEFSMCGTLCDLSL